VLYPPELRARGENEAGKFVNVHRDCNVPSASSPREQILHPHEAAYRVQREKLAFC
jgi:hypothetical protein